METNKIKQAVSCFESGMSCSQAILSTYGDGLGIDKAVALRISAPFGGGMARMGETCGAVTGAFMALGLKYATDRNAKERLYCLVNEFATKFKSRNKSLICKELLGYDMCTPEGMNTIKEKGLVKSLCPKLVQDAAEILEEMLQR